MESVRNNPSTFSSVPTSGSLLAQVKALISIVMNNKFVIKKVCLIVCSLFTSYVSNHVDISAYLHFIDTLKFVAGKDSHWDSKENEAAFPHHQSAEKAQHAEHPSTTK